MTPRRAALEALVDITESGAYANLRLKEACARLSHADAAWVSAAVYTTLDHLLTLDWRLAPFLHGKENRFIRGVLRLGACQLLYMRTPAHAAVSESVALAREIGKGALSGRVNAVLRSLSRAEEAPPLPVDTAERLSILYSVPGWIVHMWMEDYGLAFTEALLAAPGAGTSVRPQHPERAAALAALLPGARQGRYDENALYPPPGFDPASCPAFTEGRMAVQGEAAMLACRAAGACRGKRVLDACAAPGGKSAYLYSLAEGEVSLCCLEPHEHRAELMQKSFARLGVQAEVRTADARAHNEAWNDAFDLVLLDAPCSGLGLFRDKPDLRYQKQPSDLLALAALQRELLAACRDRVKPGGILLYATCTLSKAENEAQISAFLAENPDYSLETMPLPIENNGQLQLFPNVHGKEGFFMARMKRCV